ncbi:MAG: FGGY family carbohydrate kinase, partial [Eubacteriales bacterium]
MGLLMGLDIGSTSIKAIIYDLGGNCISAGSCKIPLSYPDKDHSTWCVWEPVAIWDCVITSIKQAITGISGDEVSAIAVTGFGMDGVPIDKNGRPLYPFISWHCMRTLPQYKAFQKKINAEELFRETGRRAIFIDSIYRMMWMKENYPEILEKTYKWLLIEDYINFMLCGRIATDYSMGSTTSAFKPDTHTWSDLILRLAGISGDLFPQPLPSGTVLGEVLPKVCAETGLKKGTIIALGGHDYICSAFAVGAVDESRMMDINGTWEMIVRGCRSINLSSAMSTRAYYIG